LSHNLLTVVCGCRAVHKLFTKTMQKVRAKLSRGTLRHFASRGPPRTPLISTREQLLRNFIAKSIAANANNIWAPGVYHCDQQRLVSSTSNNIR